MAGFELSAAVIVHVDAQASWELATTGDSPESRQITRQTIHVSAGAVM